MSTSFSPPPPLAPSPTPSFKKVAKKAPFMMFALEKQQIMPELRGLGPAQLAKNDKVSSFLHHLPPKDEPEAEVVYLSYICRGLDRCHTG